jgi:hypothetical protein
MACNCGTLSQSRSRRERENKSSIEKSYVDDNDSRGHRISSKCYKLPSMLLYSVYW